MIRNWFQSMNNNGQLICLKTQWRKTWWDWVCLVPYPQLSPSVICSCSPNIIFIALTTFGKRSTVNISQKYLPDEIDNQLLPLVLGGGQPSPRRLALLCTLKLQKSIPVQSLRQASTTTWKETWCRWLTWLPSWASSQIWCQSAELWSHRLWTQMHYGKKFRLRGSM